MHKMISNLKKDLVDNFSKRIADMEMKQTVEIANLKNIIDTELGLGDDLETIEEDESKSDPGSVSSSSLKKESARKSDMNLLNIQV